MNKNENVEANQEFESKNHKDECECEILDSSILNKCTDVIMEIPPKFETPIVIAEFKVQIDVESKIKLAEPAIEIKRIKKNVFLTECRLVAKTDKVFIKGYVRKNIEYATMDSLNNSAICGNIKHTTVHVPFHCTAELKNMRGPELKSNPLTQEITYISKDNHGKDRLESDLISGEFFNEKVFCKLISAIIHEADIEEEVEKIECLKGEHLFQSFIEKEVICLSIKLLQNQEICEEKKEKFSTFDF
jgi:hypothetical protein